MMKQIFKSFPDNKPISGLCIVEDIAKCPSGYSPVSNILVTKLFILDYHSSSLLSVTTC